METDIVQQLQSISINVTKQIRFLSDHSDDPDVDMDEEEIDDLEGAFNPKQIIHGVAIGLAFISVALLCYGCKKVVDFLNG